MIGKICPRGKRVGGLIRYLYATGPAQREGRRRRNPHTDPRVIGGFDDPAELKPTVGECQVPVDHRAGLDFVVRKESKPHGLTRW